ncbi:putative polyketide synthase [Biscogniauxia mediterranea]|nr:putative polyketide synthase [Biscogniauxia mediterranea]
MHYITVFAGLGSDLLFSANTAHTALDDSSVPESQIILRECHDIFRREIQQAIDARLLTARDIDLDDFVQPEILLRPPVGYYHNTIIQHTTIYLVQTLRYISQHLRTSDIKGVAGFCVGLLPAVVVSTSHNITSLIQRAEELFHVALWIGINSEIYRRTQISTSKCSPSIPWSIVVNDISTETVTELIEANVETGSYDSVYISAINSPTCVTLSGRGDQLLEFAKEKLPPKCKTRSTNVLTLYHNRSMLGDVCRKTIEALESTLHSRLDVPVTLIAPLFSTITGTPLRLPNNSETLVTLRKLVNVLLEMIFFEPVDWTSVQSNILDEIRSRDESEPFKILNFGPGYGLSRSAGLIPKAVEILDVSGAVQSPIPIGGPSNISLDDIAIVGMAVELPDAQDADELWKNLCDGMNSCSEDFYLKKDANGNRAKRSMNTRYGNFLRNPFLFDNELFDISPREALSIDPQQRVLLQTAYRALENAGYVPDTTPSFARDTFGCFIGSATLDYTENVRQNIDVYYSPGTLRAFQSGRISYYFGWTGPSMTLDTACSSSMVAMHQAVRAISSRDCRAALVGGVNVISSPDMYLGLDRAHFLSPTGQCKAFDASADGYCRSEGCGVFVIKSMRDALAEGDRIHAIIKGVEVNQSGNSHSITHPHAPTQEQLFTKLFEKTKTHPHQISVVETHGTGTQAGDPNEVASLRSSLCKGRDSRNPVHFTSIKANIGHCEAASGAAALAKVILMMKHNTIPPQISLKNLNPKIEELGVDGAVIDTNLSPWPQTRGQAKLALINNFGAAGSNGALILRDYQDPAPIMGSSNEQTYVLGISAKSVKVLLSHRDKLLANLLSASSNRFPLADICYTMTARRQLYDYRISVTANSPAALIQKLESIEPSQLKATKGTELPVAFVFSGQGSQYLGMGQELMSMYPTFSKVVHKCDKALKQNGFPGCLEVIDPTTPDMSALDANSDAVAYLQASQSAIFALEVALAQLLISWNIRPDVVVGHSLGEYAALVTAGVLSIVDGALLVARRAQLMATQCELQSSSMLAVNLENRYFEKLSICCENSPTDCVLGGPISPLQHFREHLAAVRQVKSKFLDVPLAYHTQAMDPVIPALTQYAKGFMIRTPTLPVISNVLGRVVRKGDASTFTPEYFARHSRQVVEFQKGLEDFVSQDSSLASRLWIEIGPSASLLPMIATQASSPKNMSPCLRKGISPSLTISQLLSLFYISATPINWRQAFSFENAPRLVDLPGLPFFQSEFVVPYPRETQELNIMASQNTATNTNDDIFIHLTVEKKMDSQVQSATYETSIQLLKDFITGHIVCDHALCPASVYHQMVLSALSNMMPNSTPELAWSLADVSYISPLLYTSRSTSTIRIDVTSIDNDRNVFSFEIFSVDTFIPHKNTIHCKGHVKRKDRKSIELKHARASRMVERHISRLTHPDPGVIVETFSTKSMYENVFTRVVTYSELYQQVRFIRISPDGDEAYAQCRYPGTPGGSIGSNVVFMDVLLHVSGFIANLSIASSDVCICKAVESCLVLRRPGSPGAQFDVYCTIMDSPQEGVIVANAQAFDKLGVMAVFKGIVFQRIHLDKLRQAFNTASNRGRVLSSPPKATGRLSTQGHSGINPSRPISHQATFHVNEQQLNPAVRDLIAQTCGVDPRFLSTTSSLEELGFDSLLMIELEDLLLQKYPRLTISGLTDCTTVKDVEWLCSGSLEIATPSSTAIKTPNDNTSTELVPDIQKLTRNIIAETCNVDMNTINSDSDLVSLGIDSLMIFELESSLLKISKGGSISSAGLFNCHTVGDIERLVVSNCQEVLEVEDPETSSGCTSPTAICTPINANSTDTEIILPASTIDRITHVLNLNYQPEVIQSYPTPRALTGEDSLIPLYLIHDGSGICTHYRRLGPLNRPVYAIHNPKLLDNFDSWASLDEMADEYAKIIMSSTPGPYLVGGWSFGGVAAFEVARRLSAQGHVVVGTILIDSPPPVNHQPLSPHIIDIVTSQGKSASTETSRAIRHLTRRSFSACARLLGDFIPDPSERGLIPRVFLLRSRDGWRNPSDPETIEHLWLQDRSNPQTVVSGWEIVTGMEVSWQDIPGNHFQVFDETNSASVSDAILKVCDDMVAAYLRS